MRQRVVCAEGAETDVASRSPEVEFTREMLGYKLIDWCEGGKELPWPVPGVKRADSVSGTN